jgi:hypothetical protein
MKPFEKKSYQTGLKNGLTELKRLDSLIPGEAVLKKIFNIT